VAESIDIGSPPSTGSRRPWRPLLIVALATLLVLSRVAGLVPLPSLTAGFGAPAAQPASAGVSDFQLLADGAGWALTGDGLMATTDNGVSWKDVAPQGVTASGTEGVYFRDPSTGWLVAAPTGEGVDGSPVTSSVYRTTDGGATWQQADLPSASSAGTAYVDFLTSEHGWVMIHDASGASVSLGELFETTDGGASWTRLPDPPIGGDITFTSSSDGWTAGGPSGDELYRTTDGGKSWTRVSVKLPEEFSGRMPSYATPTFFGDQGVLAVTLADGDADASVAYYTSTDSGASWALAATEPTKSLVVAPATVPTDILSASDWVQVDPSGKDVTAVKEGGDSAITASSGDLPEGTAKSQWGDSLHAWNLVSSGQCLEEKTQCYDISQLVSTSDGGVSWRPIAGTSTASP
jgi:photosystem II stability/assembly factor-like uncharacterized protein